MKYSEAFDIAAAAKRSMTRRGERYRDGVERAAAIAVCNAELTGTDRRGIVTAMVMTFDAFKISINPKWDGSIA